MSNQIVDNNYNYWKSYLFKKPWQTTTVIQMKTEIEIEKSETYANIFTYESKKTGHEEQLTVIVK